MSTPATRPVSTHTTADTTASANPMPSAHGYGVAAGSTVRVAGSSATPDAVTATPHAAIAIAAALAQPWSEVVLSGASTTEMLDSNLAALEVTYDAELDKRLAGLAEPSADYWSERASLAWN